MNAYIKNKKLPFKTIKLNKTIWHSFFKIFSLFFFSMLPIALHSIIPLFITSFEHEGIFITGSIIAQAINYSQPILFFAINILILVIVQVSFLMKNFKKKENFEKNKKEIINTGMFITLILSFGISLIFIFIMMLYSEFSIKGENEFLQLYSKLYILVMAIYILFIGIVSYFIYVILETGVKLSFIIIFEWLFSTFDILLICLFLFFIKGLSPVIRISLGTLIATIIKLIVVSIIYKIKVISWKIKEIKFNIFFAKKIFKMTWMLSTFMIVYVLNIVIQMSFINLISSNHGYLYYSGGESLIIISRIIILSIINMLVIIPKSLGRALVLSLSKPKEKEINKSINQFKIGQKYNLYGIIIFILISLSIFFLLNNLSEFVFKNQKWISGIIPIDLQSTIPFSHDINITYLDVIKKFIWNGFIMAIFSQSIINFAINFRGLLYLNFETSKPLFCFTIISFFIFYGLGSYFFGVYLQNYLFGMIGFYLAQLFYGFFSLCLTSFFYFKITNKHINLKLEAINEEKLKPFFKNKNYYQYFSDRKNKINICLNNK